MDIGIGHSAAAGLIVAGIGLAVIAAFILVIRYGAKAGDSTNHST